MVWSERMGQAVGVSPAQGPHKGECVRHCAGHMSGETHSVWDMQALEQGDCL